MTKVNAGMEIVNMNLPFAEKHPPSIPFNDSYEEKNLTAYDLRPRHSLLDRTSDSITDETLTPGTRASRSRKRLSKSVSSGTVIRYPSFYWINTACWVIFHAFVDVFQKQL